MLRRVRQYLSALILLAAISAAYQAAVAVALVPPTIEPVKLVERPIVNVNDSVSDLFAEDAWQRGNCKQLQTADGMLLFEQWKQTADDQWKLWPITIVVGRGMGNASSQPVILESPQGAEIKFSRAFDPLSGDAPPIERGWMVGPVTIRRPDVDVERSLFVRTANVQIDNRKVWTAEAIQMHLGKTRMIGRDLTLHLANSAGSSSTGSGAASVLDHLELIYLDELEVPLEQPLWKPVRVVASSDHANSGKVQQLTAPPTPAKLSIQCGGSVEYDFTIDEMSLRDDVALIHEVGGQVMDRFDCQSLKMLLRDPTNRALTRKGPLDWLSRIEAKGTPAVANLTSFDTQLAAETIQFDASGGLFQAHGSKGIHVRRGWLEARLSRLVYQFDTAMPEAIGAIDVRGAGNVRINHPRIPIQSLRWKDGLKVQPEGLATSDNFTSKLRAWIDGDVTAKFADGGDFHADAIEGVLRPSLETTATGKRQSFVPEFFQAKGDVQIETSQLASRTQLLSLFFLEENDPLAKSTGNKRDNGVSSMRQWVLQPGSSGKVEPVARNKPSIRGDSISAQVRINESGLTAKDLSVAGAVEVVHQMNAGGELLPITYSGEQLRLKIDDDGRDIVQLGSGSAAPARFDLGDGYFIGSVIQIRPSDNVVWINSAGEFRIPTQVLPSDLAGNGNSNTQWIKAPLCRWNGEMLFDGKKAVLTDGVDITASLVNDRQPWDLNATGDRLEVVMQNDVQVREVKSLKKATIQNISLLRSASHPVIVQAFQRAADGVLESKHVLQTESLSLMPGGGGTFKGSGPGWYRTWMRAKAIQMTPGKRPASPSALGTSTRADDLTGAHLVFHESIRGDFSEQRLSFHRGVRVGSRPVVDWDDAVDARAMDAISAGESTLDCDELSIHMTPGYRERRLPGMSTPWELAASDGVVFRTRTDAGSWDCRASRASFASLKDLFVISGSPNRPAVLNRSFTDGKPDVQAAVRELTFRVSTMEIDELVPEFARTAAPENLRVR